MIKQLIYITISLAAGIGIPIMATLNAGLGARLSSPWLAAVVLFLVGFASSMIVLGMIGAPKLPAVAPPPQYFAAGILTAFYILTVTALIPHFGVSNVIFFVLLGQILSAALIDHFGLFGAMVTPVSPLRIVGMVVMMAGIYLARKPL